MNAPPGGGMGAPRGALPPMARWHGGWFGWLGSDVGVVVAVTIAALPLAVLAAWGLARWRRRRGAVPAWAWRSSLAEVAIAYGTAPWVLMTLMPGRGFGGGGVGRVDLVPLSDVVSMPPYQVLGNLLAFAALGFVAPVRFASMASFGRILAVAAAASALIEAAQHLLGRVSSVDDVLLNTAGAVLAALASRPWWVRRRKGASGPVRTASDHPLV